MRGAPAPNPKTWICSFAQPKGISEPGNAPKLAPPPCGSGVLPTIEPSLQGRFDLSQWRSWPEDERWELIGGEAFNMGAAPRVSHQQVVLHLAVALSNFLKGHPCIPLVSTVDVFLNEVDTVVQPDLAVVCRPDVVRDDGVHGAPEFVAEVLSDSTAFKDLGVKKVAYAQAGVQEYWVIHPVTRVVKVFILRGRTYAQAIEYLPATPVPSSVLPGFVWTLE